MEENHRKMKDRLGILSYTGAVRVAEDTSIWRGLEIGTILLTKNGNKSSKSNLIFECVIFFSESVLLFLYNLAC